MKKTFILITTVIASMFGSAVKAQDADKEIVKVYRWYNPIDANYVTVADGEYQDGQLLNWHYKDKTLLFFAYRNPGEGRIGVYSWYNPTTKDLASIAEDEYTDDQMLKMGYKDKHFQFYGISRRAATRCRYTAGSYPSIKTGLLSPKKVIQMPITKKATVIKHSSTMVSAAAAM